MSLCPADASVVYPSEGGAVEFCRFSPSQNVDIVDKSQCA